MAAIFGGVIGVFAPKPVLPKPDLPRRELEWDSVYREPNTSLDYYGIIVSGEYRGKLAYMDRATGKIVPGEGEPLPEDVLNGILVSGSFLGMTGSPRVIWTDENS